jgi:hypothetical protein
MSEESAPAQGHPVLVAGRLEEPLSRWLWLVKWLLLIPHYIVLAFLWLAFFVVTVIAFFAILFTARYPRALFGFNLGVLRWSWRVSYYGYSALGTDRYPPFSFGEEPDYPARLDIAYPQRLSRGLVLVKWWLLAIPHYLLLGVLVGGAGYTVTSVTNGQTTTWTTTASTSLLSLLVFFAGVALLFTARYPRGLYDFALGVDRWVLRVIAYVALMTDAYPPFRLDQGGSDWAEPPGPEPMRPSGAAAAEPGSVPAPSSRGPAMQGGQGRAGFVVALIAGILAALLGLGVLAVSGGAFWLNSRRDAAGFVSTNAQTLSTPTAAITAEDVDLRLDSGTATWVSSSNRFGTLRVRGTSLNGAPVFIGVAPQSAVNTWLAAVAHDQITDINGGAVVYQRHQGQANAASPTAQSFWSASVNGSGTQELRWRIQSGRWALVLARPSGAPGVQGRVDVGANIPGLTGLATGLLIGGIVLLFGGIALVIVGGVGLARPAGRSGDGRGAMPVPAPPSPRSGSVAESSGEAGARVGTMRVEGVGSEQSGTDTRGAP